MNRQELYSQSAIRLPANAHTRRARPCLGSGLEARHEPKPVRKRVRFAVLLALVLQSTASLACDLLVGTYAREPGGEPAVWFDRDGAGYAVSILDNVRQAWMVVGMPVESVPVDKLKKVASVDAHSCGLTGSNWVIFRTFPGASFDGPGSVGPFSAVEDEFDTRTSTGIVWVHFTPCGRTAFTQLYPVPSGMRAPRREALSDDDAVEACPGGDRPDLDATAYATLPAGLRAWIESTPGKRRDAVCGQLLDALMMQDDVELAPSLGYARMPRRAFLVRALLNAGAVPRRADGQANWWGASAGLLKHSRPAKDLAPPLDHQGESDALFSQALLPKLIGESAVDAEELTPQTARRLARDAMTLPDPVAVRTLDLIESLQEGEEKDAFEDYLANDLLGRIWLDKLSEPVFAWLVQRVGVAAVERADLLVARLMADERAASRGLGRSAQGIEEADGPVIECQ